jgi:hypothetical protein
LSHQLRVDAYGEELAEGEIANEWRPSPFTEVVNSAKREIRRPERIYPASFIAPEPSYSLAPDSPNSYSYVDTYLDPAPSTAQDVPMTARSTAAVTATSIALHTADFRTVAFNPATASGRAAAPPSAGSTHDELELNIPRVTASLTRVQRNPNSRVHDISPRATGSEHSETATN